MKEDCTWISMCRERYIIIYIWRMLQGLVACTQTAYMVEQRLIRTGIPDMEDNAELKSLRKEYPSPQPCHSPSMGVRLKKNSTQGY